MGERDALSDDPIHSLCFSGVGRRPESLSQVVEMVPERDVESDNEYMATFEADSPGFYRPEGPVPTWERLKSAWRGYWFPREKRH